MTALSTCVNWGVWRYVMSWTGCCPVTGTPVTTCIVAALPVMVPSLYVSAFELCSATGFASR